MIEKHAALVGRETCSITGIVLAMGLLSVMAVNVVFAMPGAGDPRGLAPGAIEANFYVSPDLLVVNPGDVFTVQITVDHVTTTVKGWQVALAYDPDVLVVSESTPGDFLSHCSSVLPLAPSWQASEAEVMVALTCLLGDSGGKASGVLTTLTMQMLPTAPTGAQSLLEFDVEGSIVTKFTLGGGASPLIPGPDKLHHGWIKSLTPSDSLPADTPSLTLTPPRSASTPAATLLSISPSTLMPTSSPPPGTSPPMPSPAFPPTATPSRPAETPTASPRPTFSPSPVPVAPTLRPGPVDEPVATITPAALPGTPGAEPTPVATASPISAAPPTLVLTPVRLDTPAPSPFEAEPTPKLPLPGTPATPGVPSNQTATSPSTQPLATNATPPPAAAVLVSTLAPSGSELTAAAPQPTSAPAASPGRGCWPAASLSVGVVGLVWLQKRGAHYPGGQRKVRPPSR
jgi:hypothetical protein